jgi:hypothetical protein
MLLRSYPSAAVGRWKRYVDSEQFRVYFFDDLQNNPAELRRSILRFLGADPDKPGGRLKADYNSWTRMEKLPLTNNAIASGSVLQKGTEDLRSATRRAAGDWPARYGFSAVSLKFNCHPRLWPTAFLKLNTFNFLSGALRPDRGHAEYASTRRR